MTTAKQTTALSLLLRLRASNHTAFWVGGCVRDMLRGEAPKDFDIATSASPDEIAALFAKTVPVGAAFGVMVVIEGDESFEVATFRKDAPYADHRHPTSVEFGTPEEDARRRDFTINALFYDPVEERVIDFVDGRADLERGIIRTVGAAEDRFWEDALRLLRAVRFAAALDFTIEAETRAAIEKNARLINYVSAERIRDELTRMLIHPRRRAALELLDATGLLEIVLPEATRMKGVEQPPQFHPEGDVWTHTLLALENLGPDEVEPALAWATLLHDIGKPDTFEVDPDGRIRFSNHQKVGAEIAEDILHRLRLPRLLIADVVNIVRRHMDFINVRQMRRSTLRRFLSAETIALELDMHRADCMASNGETENLEFCRDKIAEFEDEAEPLMPPPLLTGKDLKRMGYIPGPIYGRILEDVTTRQLEDELTSFAEARDYVLANFPQRREN